VLLGRRCFWLAVAGKWRCDAGNYYMECGDEVRIFGLSKRGNMLALLQEYCKKTRCGYVVSQISSAPLVEEGM